MKIAVLALVLLSVGCHTKPPTNKIIDLKGGYLDSGHSIAVDPHGNLVDLGPRFESACIWHLMPHSGVYDEEWECISKNGAIRGTVSHWKPDYSHGRWAAYFNGAYCDEGAEFVSRSAAFDCVDSRAGNKERMSGQFAKPCPPGISCTVTVE